MEPKPFLTITLATRREAGLLADCLLAHRVLVTGKTTRRGREEIMQTLMASWHYRPTEEVFRQSVVFMEVLFEQLTAALDAAPEKP